MFKEALEELAKKIAAKQAQGKAIYEKHRKDGKVDFAAMSKDEVAEADTLAKELTDAQAEYANLEAKQKAYGFTATPAPKLNSNPSLPMPGAAKSGEEDDAPASLYPRYKRMRAFPQTRKGEEQAFRFYKWLQAVHPRTRGEAAIKWCQDHNIALKAAGSTGNELGGALIPDEFINVVIDLREVYGVIRQIVRIVPMPRGQMVQPRRAGGLTVYFPAENEDITASEKQWNNVGMTARKMAALSRLPTELIEDAAIDIADDLAREFAWAFAKKEDQCGFLGDGTSSFGRMVGIIPQIRALDTGTPANIAGLVTGSGNAWSALTIGDHEEVIARLPEYADTPMTCWVCSRTYYYTTMVRLELAAGGVTATEVREGARRTPTFMGYPVKFAQVLPRVSASDHVPVLFGSFDLGAMLGEAREMSIADSSEFLFGSDAIAIRATERVDFNAHSVGNADATAANREPGPIIALRTQ